MPPHETASRIPYDSATDSLGVFVDDPLVFSPGSDFAYSSHGYTLLGAVLEQVSGAPFGQLLEREIAAPQDLDSVGLDSADQSTSWARHYEVKGKWYRHDLARLVSGLTHRNLIRPDTLEMILTPQVLPDGSPNAQNYALGWRLAQTKKFLGGHESYRVAHHGGVSSGSSAFVALFPNYSFAVTVLANSRVGSGPLSDLAFEVAEPFMAKIVE